MSELNLTNHWPEQPLAVVIGAGAMGTAVARRFGQDYRVLLVDIDTDRLAKESAALTQMGVQNTTAVCNVTDPLSVSELAATVKALGGFRALVQVAGLSPSLADWRTIMSVNLLGPALVTEALLPLVETGSCAVLIASLSAHLRAVPGELLAILQSPLQDNFWQRLMESAEGDITSAESYMWSKIGVLALAKQRAVAWGRQGGRVVSMSPGLIASTQGKLEFEKNNSKAQLLAACPARRQGNLQEIANAAAFLTSIQASYINGTDLLVDGGALAGIQSGE